MNAAGIVHTIWRDHRTKTLGFIQITLGVLATTDGVFTEAVMKWIILCSGLVTAWLGFFNTHQARQAAEDAK